MSEVQWFEIVRWLAIVLPVAVAGGIFSLPRPKALWLRAPLAIVAGWAVSIWFTAAVYNPAGIAYGHALGDPFPEGRFDNNTIASHLVGGWIYPAIMCAVMMLVRAVRLRIARPR